jgi:hypothetical protein
VQRLGGRIYDVHSAEIARPARSGTERMKVDQLRASWNSLLSWLREVQAWREDGDGMVSCTHDDYH